MSVLDAWINLKQIRYEGLQPPPVGDSVGVPILNCRLDAGDSASVNSNSLGGSESAGFHDTRSCPATISRFNSAAFS
jgi:hypothetical protein